MAYTVRAPTTRLGVLFALAWAAATMPVALAVADDVCVSCHSSRDALSDAGERAAQLVVDEKSLAGSIHDGFSCTQCHADLAADDAPIPHAARLAPADCSACHADTVEQFRSASIHATRMKLPVGAKSPCSACHGSHQIRSKSDPESPTHKHRVAISAPAARATNDPLKENVGRALEELRSRPPASSTGKSTRRRRASRATTRTRPAGSRTPRRRSTGATACSCAGNATRAS